MTNSQNFNLSNTNHIDIHTLKLPLLYMKLVNIL